MTDSPLSQRLIDYGAIYTPADTERGQPFWQLTYADGPFEWGGRTSIFVDVQGEAGQRLVGVRVRLFNGGNSFKATEPKPGDDFAVDFPMYAAGNAYGVSVADGSPSDEVRGMGLIAFKPHVVYKLVYKRAIAGGAIDTPPTPPSAKDSIQVVVNGAVVWHN